MTVAKNIVRWTIASLAIKDFKDNRGKYFRTFFTTREIRHLARKPLQSAAGFLALKRALIKLCHDVAFALKLDEKSFVIAHTPDGAPVITKTKAIVHNTLSGIHVSITHTRTHAFGIAAIEVKAHG